MLDSILKEMNNYFVNSIEYSAIAIEGPEITGCSGTYLASQYINIEGSVLNDGTYKISSVLSGVITLTETLADETGLMTIYGLRVPASVIDLYTKISTYEQSATPGIASESQGNRSVSYESGSSWQQTFAKNLNAYRLAFCDKLRWSQCGRLIR